MLTPRETQTALTKLARLAAQRRNLDTEIDGVVAMLKTPALDGYCAATWEQVGAALGVTRQSAQERYRTFSWQMTLSGDPATEPVRTARGGRRRA